MQREATLSVDGQEILNFGRQSIPTFVPGHRLNSGPFGTMGVGLPFAVGAKAAKPSAQVICLHGDGSFGDGVNVAARLEALAEPGGSCLLARVQEDVADRLDLALEDMGEQALKNITRPIRAYRVVTAAGSASARASSGPPLPDKPSIAVLPFANVSGDPEQEYFAVGRSRRSSPRCRASAGSAGEVT
jgi:hypothetical protein